MKRLFCSFLILIIFSSLIYSQEVLSDYNTSWTTVVTGQVICEPQLTSYGFGIITDGQDLSAYSNNGKLLWSKPLQRGRKAFFSSLNDDFFGVVTNSGQTFNLYNPSGYKIWSKDVEYTILDKPFSGRDGRIFIRGDSIIQCFGINGISKWILETPLQSQNFPPLELNDGSLLIFLDATKDDKSTGIRISPFGEILEQITFSGKIENAFHHNQGVLLIFKDGTSGLVATQDNKVQTQWLLLISLETQSQISNSRFVSNPQNESLIFINAFPTSAQINTINPHTGSILSTFTIPDINATALTSATLNNEGLFIADTKTAYFYSLEPHELWSAKIPSSQSSTQTTSVWNYLFYSSDNHLILCNTNWSLNAYKAIQNSSSPQTITKNDLNYNSFYTITDSSFLLEYDLHIDKNIASKNNLTILQNGNYGYKEIQMKNDLLSISEYLENTITSSNGNTRQKQTVINTDTTGVNLLLQQYALYGTSDCANHIAALLKNFNNKTYLLTLIKSLQNCGYDPDGKILSSIDIISHNLSQKDDALVKAICDAIYSICVFMGRPAFNSKGKTILSNFIFANYNTSTINYVRNTMKKIADLDL